MQESDVTRIQLAKLLSQLQPIVPADIRHVKKELKKKVRVGNSVITKCITMILEYPGWLFHFLLEVMTGKFCEIQFTVFSCTGFPLGHLEPSVLSLLFTFLLL